MNEELMNALRLQEQKAMQILSDSDVSGYYRKDTERSLDKIRRKIRIEQRKEGRK